MPNQTPTLWVNDFMKNELLRRQLKLNTDHETFKKSYTTTTRKAMGDYVNARMAVDYPNTQFVGLDDKTKVKLCNDALRASDIQAEVAVPPPPPNLFAELQCSALFHYSPNNAIVEREVCRIRPSLPQNLPDAGVASTLGVKPQIAFVHLPAGEREASGHNVPAIDTSLSARPRPGSALANGQTTLAKPATPEVGVPDDKQYKKFRGPRRLRSALRIHNPSNANRQQHQTLVNKSFAMDVQRHIVYMASTGHSPASIRAWIHDNVEDFALPTYVPYYQERADREGRYDVFILSESQASGTWIITVASKEQADALAHAAFDIIVETESNVGGRQAMKTLAVIAGIKKAVQLAAAAIELEAEGCTFFTAGDDVFFSPWDLFCVTKSWLVQVEGSDALKCLAHPQHLHDAAELFTAEQVWGISCLWHAAHEAWLALRRSTIEQSSARWQRGIKRSDEGRQVDVDDSQVATLVEQAESLPSSLYAYRKADDWDFEALRETFCNANARLTEEEQLEELKRIIPSLSPQALPFQAPAPTIAPGPQPSTSAPPSATAETAPAPPSSPSPRAPLYVPAFAMVSAFIPSIDQYRQVNNAPGGDGRPLGHSATTSILLPAHLQRRKKSAPLLDLGIWDAAVGLNAVADSAIPRARKDVLLDGLSNIMDSYHDAREAYIKARHGESMDPSLFQLSREMDEIMLEPEPGELPALRARVAAFQPPAPDIEAMLDHYRAGAWRPGPQAMAALSSSRLAQLEDLVAKTHEAFAKMSRKRRRELIDEIAAFATKIEDELGIPEDDRKRNPEGLPTCFLPRDTASQELLEMCLRAFTRGLLHCDIIAIAICEIIWVPGKDDLFSWRFLFFRWIVVHAHWGNRDGFARLRYRLDGASNSPTSPCLMAHEDHTRSFGNAAATNQAFSRLHDPAVNVTVQLNLTNMSLGANSPSQIVQETEWHRPTVDTLLRRLQARQMLDITTEEIDLIRDRPDTLSPEQMRIIASNGRSTIEASGSRAWTHNEDEVDSSDDEAAAEDEDVQDDETGSEG